MYYYPDISEIKSQMGVVVVEDNGDNLIAQARSTTPAATELMLQIGAICDFGTACREMIDLVEQQVGCQDQRTAEEIVDTDPMAAGGSPDERTLVHKLFSDLERDTAKAVDAVTDSDLDRVGYAGDPFATLLSLIPVDRLRSRLLEAAFGELANTEGARDVDRGRAGRRADDIALGGEDADLLGVPIEAQPRSSPIGSKARPESRSRLR